MRNNQPLYRRLLRETFFWVERSRAEGEEKTGLSPGYKRSFMSGWMQKWVPASTQRVASKGLLNNDEMGDSEQNLWETAEWQWRVGTGGKATCLGTTAQVQRRNDEGLRKAVVAETEGKGQNPWLRIPFSSQLKKSFEEQQPDTEATGKFRALRTWPQLQDCQWEKGLDARRPQQCCTWWRAAAV